MMFFIAISAKVILDFRQPSTAVDVLVPKSHMDPSLHPHSSPPLALMKVSPPNQYVLLSVYPPMKLPPISRPVDRSNRAALAMVLLTAILWTDAKWQPLALALASCSSQVPSVLTYVKLTSKQPGYGSGSFANCSASSSFSFFSFSFSFSSFFASLAAFSPAFSFSFSFLASFSFAFSSSFAFFASSFSAFLAACFTLSS